MINTNIKKQYQVFVVYKFVLHRKQFLTKQIRGIEYNTTKLSRVQCTWKEDVLTRLLRFAYLSMRYTIDKDKIPLVIIKTLAPDKHYFDARQHICISKVSTITAQTNKNKETKRWTASFSGPLKWCNKMHRVFIQTFDIVWECLQQYIPQEGLCFQRSKDFQYNAIDTGYFKILGYAQSKKT